MMCEAKQILDPLYLLLQLMLLHTLYKGECFEKKKRICNAYLGKIKNRIGKICIGSTPWS